MAAPRWIIRRGLGASWRESKRDTSRLVPREEEAGPTQDHLVRQRDEAQNGLRHVTAEGLDGRDQFLRVVVSGQDPNAVRTPGDVLAGVPGQLLGWELGAIGEEPLHVHAGTQIGDGKG